MADNSSGNSALNPSEGQLPAGDDSNLIQGIADYDGAMFISACYQRFLGRTPDASGLNAHLLLLDSGVSKRDVAKSLAETGEAQQWQRELASRRVSVGPHSSLKAIGAFSALDDAEFIAACYQHFFGREPDNSGLHAHLSLLKSGTSKEEVALRLAESEEAAVWMRDKMSGAVPLYEGSPMVAFHRRDDFKCGKTGNYSTKIADGVVKGMLQKAFKKGGMKEKAPFNELWVDLTASFEWTRGVVGIIRAELELACGLKKLVPGVRFSMQIADGFVEIQEEQLEWLLKADNVADAYMQFFGRQGEDPSEPNKIEVFAPDCDGFFHPYASNDLIVSFGWMHSRKELYFSRLKSRDHSIKICYLVYDMVVLMEQTTHFYTKQERIDFTAYIKWISENVDFMLFGGETAKKDTERYQLEENLPRKPGRAIKFGTDITKSNDSRAASDLVAELGIASPFIMTVGSLEPRKNHETLYRAYLLVLEQLGARAPQLVICGKPVWRADDLVDSLKRDPRLKGKVVLCTPTDLQLAALYENCCFTLLPSLYEGWSLTLPESLGQGKFCLTCDTPPLREIGGDLVDYVEAFDTRRWADKIIEYCNDAEKLAKREKDIRSQWPVSRWSDAAAMAYEAILALATGVRSDAEQKRAVIATETSRAPTIWMDLTLTFLHWQGGVSGVVRAELTYAYYLKKIVPNTRFFAYESGNFFEISVENLKWLFSAEDIHSAYKIFQDFWRSAEAAGTGYRNPLRGSPAPHLNKAHIADFPANSVLFFAGIDFHGDEKGRRSRESLNVVLPGSKTMISQLLYDFTPFLVPQHHLRQTCEGYAPFIEIVSNKFDYIVYGGATAQRDGLAHQSKFGLRSPPSDYIEFGSDLKFDVPDADKNFTLSKPRKGDKNLLRHMGIAGDFVMTVGTLEPRKNHECLYKAYLKIRERGNLKKPLQLVFVGKKGWKSSDFLDSFSDDERVSGEILLLSPNDEELSALYRNCKFTLLPSFYEGWSLTLPESLSYGKFCLVSDVDPLRETGRDLVEYIHPLDTYRWADRIEHYANHPEEVREWEARIRDGWVPTSWHQSTERLLELLYRAHRNFVQLQSSV